MSEVIKFFDASRGFGFIATSDEDLFFRLEGYREPTRIRWRMQLVYKPCPIPLQSGMDVVIFSKKRSSRGVTAMEWGFPDKKADPLYCVIETSTTTAESQDKAAKMWKILVTTRERVIFVGCIEDCYRIIEGYNGIRRIEIIDEQNEGQMRLKIAQ